MAVILSRDQALTVPLFSTHGTATLLSWDGGEIQVPLAPLLGASILVRSMVAESHLHPGIHGPLVLSFAVAADVLESVVDIIGAGESNVMEENIDEVVQVLNSLGVEANLSLSRIINEYYEYVVANSENIKLEMVFEPEPTNDEETPSEGGVTEAMNNLSNIGIDGEDFKKEIVFEPASNEETSSEGDKAIINSLKESYVNIEKLGVCYPNQSCHNSTVEKTYRHSICSYSCSSSSYLKKQKHRIIHTGENRYQCAICYHSFSCLGDLDRHNRIHSEEKPHTCDICNLSYSKRSFLRRHYRIHTGEKPFTCKTCNLSFSRNDNLRRHGRIHTGEKPFRCEICSYSCSDPSNLIKHKRIHTREKNHCV